MTRDVTDLNTGAAITPPYFTFDGSSIKMTTRYCGFSAGTSPTNDAVRSPPYLPRNAFCAVPVLPATETPGMAARLPVPSSTTSRIMESTSRVVFLEKIRWSPPPTSSVRTIRGFVHPFIGKRQVRLRHLEYRNRKALSE